MQFLKILFWCLLAFIAAVFTIGNWTTVPIRLWGGLIADTNLPLLLLVTFLIGLLPTLAYHHAVRWRLRQRLGAAERQVTELRAAHAVEPVIVHPVAAAPGIHQGIDPVVVPVTPPIPVATTSVATLPSSPGVI